MKKLGAMIGTIVILLGVVTYAITSGKPKETEIFNFLDATTLEQKVTDKENFVLYTYGEYCSYCKDFAPTLEGYLQDNKYKINSIVTDTDEENYDVVKKVIGEKFQGTPAIYVFKDGEVLDYMVGTKTTEELTAFANKNIKYFEIDKQV